MSAMASMKRGIAISHSLRMAIIRAANKPDEYIKHRAHYLAVGRWINEGKPDSGLIVNRPMGSRQRRIATRASRLKAHDRRREIAQRYTTGKSAKRRKARRAT